MDILVTGCTGFLASNTIRSMLIKKHRVYCTSRDKKCRFHNTNESVNNITYDMSKPINLNDFPLNIDAIYHIAATMDKSLDPASILAVNTLSTSELVKYGQHAKAQNFIYISTCGVYGYSDEIMDETYCVHPSGFYHLSKYLSEEIVKVYKNFFKNTVILRLAFPYGRGQKRGLIPLFIQKINTGMPITIYNPKNPQKINPVRIEDVMKALLASLKLNGHNIFNISSDSIMTIRDIAEKISEKIRIKAIYNEIEDENIKSMIADNRLMKEKLNIIPAKFNINDIV